MDERSLLLQQLTESNGISGYEAEVQTLVRKFLTPLGTVEKDRVGSLICRTGDNGPRVMLAGHADEIGFMVHHISDEGMLRFVQIGGWWDQVLLGQRVTIQCRTGTVSGVIGAKPPHMLQADERNKVVEKKNMYIDIGATSKDEVEAIGIKPGDAVVPQSRFEILANGRSYLGKAFDDRVGVALMIETLQHFHNNSHPNILFGVSTVMEEVGLRGARTSVEVVQPDVAIILEVALCGDIPGIKPEESSIKLGGGPAIYLIDNQMIPNIGLRNLVMDTAKELEMPIQYQVLTGGATDGGPVHLHRTGVPTVVLAVPSRHIHTHAGIIRRDDYDSTLKLLLSLIGKLDAQTVENL